MKTIFAALAALALLPGPGAGQPEKSNEKLAYAIIVSRHGVRAPTWDSKRLNQYSAQPWPDFGVAPGELTAHGRELMRIMGSYYRELFASQGLLGKSGCGDIGTTYIWADTDQRTLETGRALAESILPSCKGAIHSLEKGMDDPLFDPIAAGVAKQDPKLGLAAVAGRLGPEPAAIVDANRPAFDALNRILNGGGKAPLSLFDQPFRLTAGADAVNMSGPLNTASTLTENLLLEYTNGMTGDQLAWGRMTRADLQQVIALHTTYADLARRTPYLARVRSSNMLSRVLRSMEQAAVGRAVKGALGPAQTSLAVISGHDTNISNISGMLDLSWLLPTHQANDAAPGGALIFTLWKANGTGRLSVRLQYVAQTLDQMHTAAKLSLKAPPAGANIFIPGCSTSGEGYPCEWGAFQKMVSGAIDSQFVEK